MKRARSGTIAGMLIGGVAGAAIGAAIGRSRVSEQWRGIVIPAALEVAPTGQGAWMLGASVPAQPRRRTP